MSSTYYAPISDKQKDAKPDPRRERIAAMAMQGIISSGRHEKLGDQTTAQVAVQAADALIRELDKNKQ